MRVPKAYPMYDAYYRERVAVIRDCLAASRTSSIGRNGLHRYNNQDHSMLTAILAVLNLLDGTNHDVWAVNTEAEYHEEQQEPSQPYKRVPATQYEREPLVDSKEEAAA